MAKFRRPLEYLLPRYQARIKALSEARAALGPMGEMAENDLY